MSKLFIIGNGFDSAHEMPTGYGAFRNYLIQEYKLLDRQDEIPEIPDTVMLPDGEEKVDVQEAMRLAVWLLTWCNGKEDCDWEEFESNLAKLNYSFVMNENTLFCRDSENPFRETDNFERYASNLRAAMNLLPEIFRKWVMTIPISKKKINDIMNLFDTSCMFLSFNYTETLEVLYGIPEECICHIHGKRGGKQRILVGHGMKEIREFHVHIGADEILQKIDIGLKKDTAGAYKKNKEFFQKIGKGKITEIYSYGFSFSDVDMFYIKKICSDMDTENVIWYQNDYGLDKRKKERIEKKLRSAGFEGTFGIPYHIYS